MASFNQKTIILIPLISLLCLISYTHARNYNDTLVNKMCSATYAPNACISCIESSGKDAQTDEEVISSMLDCGDNDAMKLGIDVNKILDDVSTDPNTKHVLFSINPVIGAIISEGGTVDVLIAERKFDEARYAISKLIFAKLRICNSALAAAGISIPPPVFSGLFNVEADYKLTDQLLATVKAYSVTYT